MMKKATENYYFSDTHCSIFVEEMYVGKPGVTWLYGVVAKADNHQVLVKTFDDKNQASNFAAKLIQVINGKSTTPV